MCYSICFIDQTVNRVITRCLRRLVIVHKIIFNCSLTSNIKSTNITYYFLKHVTRCYARGGKERELIKTDEKSMQTMRQKCTKSAEKIQNTNLASLRLCEAVWESKSNSSFAWFSTLIREQPEIHVLLPVAGGERGGTTSLEYRWWPDNDLCVYFKIHHNVTGSQ